MKKTRIWQILLLGLCLFCLMGLSKSRQVILSVKVPTAIYKLPHEIPDWNWDAKDIRYLGEMSVVEWDRVMKSIDSSQDERQTYYISLEEFETLLRNNIFLLTRIGLYHDFKPCFWDVNNSIGHSRTLRRPNAYAMGKMLTDRKQNSKREAFVKAAIRILKDSRTKQAWEAQRQEFCDEMTRIWRVQDGGRGWTDYQRALYVDYETAITMALNDLLKYMKSTDFTNKVIPESRWRIVRVFNTYVEYFTDTTPFGIQSACFRMGPEATQKLIGYVQRGFDSLKK